MADGNQVATVENTERTGALATRTEPNDLMGALINAAMNPDIDADKMERMLAMYERMEARKAKVEFDEALAQMLPEIPEIGKTGAATSSSDKLLYKFAKWDEMNRIIKPILQRHGFALTFRTQEHEKGVLVTGVLSRGGHSETTSLLQSLESASSAMNSNQARGNAVSYGKRYTASALLNIITTDEEDNDAQQSQGPLTEQQVTRIREMLQEISGSEEVLVQWANKKGFQSTELEGLPFESFDVIEKQLAYQIKQRSQNNAG